MDEIQNTTASSFTPISQSGSSGGILEQEDFLEIMIAELANQDPFEPLDNREFLGQLTQMQNLEATTTMTTSLATLAESLTALTFGQQLASASSLIGQMVTGVDIEGNNVIGIVSRYEVDGPNAYLGLEGVIGHGSDEGNATVPSSTRMELASVTEVRGPVLVEINQDDIAASANENDDPTSVAGTPPSGGSESGDDSG